MGAISFLTDPAAFLAEAADVLRAEPVVSTVVATEADRAVRHGPGGRPHHWYAVVRDRIGAVVGTAMRTARFEPYPLWVCPMPEDASVGLARLLHDRGEHPGGVNGALPAAGLVAAESARLWGGRVAVSMRTCLYGLDTLVVPSGVAGVARPATYADLPLCLDWFDAFGPAARAQAGNADTAQGHAEHSADEIRRRIDEQLIVLWEVDGEVVSLAGRSAPAFGVVRIAPVYTPESRRGHGFAAGLVAEVGRRVLTDGNRACLFTDLDNPVSNRLYQRLGYRRVVDMANHTLVGGSVPENRLGAGQAAWIAGRAVAR